MSYEGGLIAQNVENPAGIILRTSNLQFNKSYSQKTRFLPTNPYSRHSLSHPLSRASRTTPAQPRYTHDGNACDRARTSESGSLRCIWWRCLPDRPFFAFVASYFFMRFTRYFFIWRVCAKSTAVLLLWVYRELFGRNTLC